MKRVIGQREPAPWPESTPFAPEQRHDIGLIGEFNIAGEFWHIQPLLDELGIRVLGSLSGDGTFRRDPDHASGAGQYAGLLAGAN